MSTNASIGYGTAFQRGDGADPEVFTAVAGITSISFGGLSKETIDASDVDSADRFREYIAGMLDGGDLTIEAEFDPDGPHVTNWLADLAKTTGTTNYKVVFPDTTEWTLSAFMTGFQPGAPFDDKMTCSSTYKISGKPGFFA